MLLGFLFFIIAAVYSFVGFGGGSSYIALLAASDLDYKLIPKLALVCNIIVVLSSSFFFYRKRLIKRNIFIPIIISSAPMAFIGGLYPISAWTFYSLLIMTLFLVSLKILLFNTNQLDERRELPINIALIIGGVVGLLSGLVGIGGGIFLSPILILGRWVRAKEAAAISCYFILINSIFGLMGQMYKGDIVFKELMSHWYLFLAVLIGGQIGIRLSTKDKTSNQIIEKSTGILILLISFNLLRKFL